FLPVFASPAAHLYWGALVNGNPPTDAMMQPGGAVDLFEQQSGKRMSLIQWGQSWRVGIATQNFPTHYLDNVRQHGSIGVLDWGSRDYNVSGPGNCYNNPSTFSAAFQLKNITAGLFDPYITTWATAAKNWGHPFFLRFDWEMNGSWSYPWSEK